MSGEAALDKMIATARYLAQDFSKDSAKAARDAVDAELKATANAGTSPDGVAWEATKAGGRAMKNAASHIAVSIIGTVLLIKLNGPDIFHHFSTRGTKARPVIPTGSMPQKLGQAVRRGFVEVWKNKVSK